MHFAGEGKSVYTPSPIIASKFSSKCPYIWEMFFPTQQRLPLGFPFSDLKAHNLKTTLQIGSHLHNSTNTSKFAFPRQIQACFLGCFLLLLYYSHNK